MEKIKIKPLTEEQKSEVKAYFQNKALNELKQDKKNQRIWFNYGRMRQSYWERIDIAEQYMEMITKERQTQYRFIKENEIKEKLKEFEIKNGWGYNYEVVNLGFYQDWRVLEIWIIDGLKDNGQTKRSQTIDIEERFNPLYFKELLKRFKLVS